MVGTLTVDGGGADDGAGQYPYPQTYLPPQVTGTTETGELDSKGLTTPGVNAVPELDARRV